MVETSPQSNNSPHVRWPQLRKWELRLEHAQQGESIDVAQPATATDAELKAICTQIHEFGFCHYRAPVSASALAIRTLYLALGLRNLDSTVAARTVDMGVESLSIITARSESDRGSRYQPYSPTGLGWHTDGYANAPNRSVRTFTLHCLYPAHQGGANQLVDPRLVMARLALLDPQLVQALEHPQAITIPANVDGKTVIRPARDVAVFARATDGELLTRYTERKRYVRWHPHTRAARDAFMLALRQQAKHTATVVLNAGEGIICNNLLHNRTPFIDHTEGPSRTLWRGRFFEPVS